MRRILLRTPLDVLHQLDIEVGSKSKRPVKVDKAVLNALLRDYDTLVAAARNPPSFPPTILHSEELQ